MLTTNQIKSTVKHLLLSSSLNPIVVKKMAQWPLGVLKQRQDFNLLFDSGKMSTEFVQRNGLELTWNYLPAVNYDIEHRAWRIEIDGAVTYSDDLPLYEVLNEFRAYSYLGRPPEDAVIIDVGGSRGLSSFIFASLCPRGKIFILEPDPLCAQAIKRKMDLNPDAAVTWIPKGLGDKSGFVKFISEPGGTSHFEKLAGQNNHSIDSKEGNIIPVISLKDLRNQYDISKVDLIKMDIEGMEIDLKEDLVKLVEEFPQCVVMAASYHVQKDGRTSSAFLEEYANKIGTVEAKTAYPLHPTTMIVNKSNTRALELLRKIRE